MFLLFRLNTAFIYFFMVRKNIYIFVIVVVIVNARMFYKKAGFVGISEIFFWGGEQKKSKFLVC